MWIDGINLFSIEEKANAGPDIYLSLQKTHLAGRFPRPLPREDVSIHYPQHAVRRDGGPLTPITPPPGFMTIMLGLIEKVKMLRRAINLLRVTYLVTL